MIDNKQKKQSYYIKRYICSKAAAKRIPVAGTFELTGRCNFNCKMCYVRKSNDEVMSHGGEISADKWLELGKEAKDAGLVFLLLTGGEPLIRKDFPEIYSGLTKLGLSISINTNGSLITDRIKELFTEFPPALINVTLYAAGNEAYREFCDVINVYTKVLDNLRWIKSSGISVNLNTTISPWNVSQLPKIRRIAETEGVNLRITPYNFPPVRRENAEGFRRLAPHEVGKILAEDFLIRNGYEYVCNMVNSINTGCGISPDCSIENGEGMNCMAGKSQFWINSSGEMTPCGMFTTPTAKPFEIGFSEAWKSISQASDGITLCADCVNCENKKICTSCAAVTSAETGTFDGKPLYMCEVTKAYKEEIYRISGQNSKDCF